MRLHRLEHEFPSRVPGSEADEAGDGRRARPKTVNEPKAFDPRRGARRAAAPSDPSPDSDTPEASFEEAREREEEMKLVQRLFVSPSPARMVVFCGVEHGNGCSRVSVRAAETLASQRTENVCVVDANLRAPSLHGYFKVSPEPGFKEALCRGGAIDAFLQKCPDSGVWVLPSGSPGTICSLLTSDNLQSRLREVQALFPFVLIDAPPATLYADAAVLGQLADGVVLVVEARSTHREAARRAKRTLEIANARVLAAVLNRRTFDIPEKIYRRL